MTPEEEREWGEEAERLKLLDVDAQRQIVEIHRRTAKDAKVPKVDRKCARERADALERLLGLSRRKR